jgi:hypothetical protein
MLLEGAVSLSSYACSSRDDHWPCNGFTASTVPAAKSKAAGALFGFTPKKYQSGEKDVTGGITRAGDEMARTAARMRAGLPS